MSMRFKGGIISATPPTTTAYTASGAWTLQQQMQAQGSGLWPAAGGYNLFLWGANSYGQLGQSNIVNKSSPTQIGSKVWSYIAEGTSHTLGVKNNGSLWSWGLGASGQLGQNSTISFSSPVQVGALTNWSKVAAGKNNSFGIKTDGTLWSWGTNFRGSAGLNIPESTSISSPTQIGSDTDWLNLSCGYFFSIAVKTNGTLWSWGYNDVGELGIGVAGATAAQESRSSPTQIGALTTWTSAGTAGWGGSGVGFGIKGGQLWAWGYGGDGILPIMNVSRSSPIQIGALTTWSFVSGGRSHAIALRNDNTLWAWGRGNHGVLGQNNYANKSSPVQVGGSWISATGFNYTSMGIRSNGTLWSWGYNNVGQLGINNTTEYSSPKQVGALTTWTKISKTTSSSNFGSAINP